MVTWFNSDRTISFSIQSATSSDFAPLATRAGTADWLSVQIVICSFTGLFLRQLATQSSIAANLCLKGCSILSQWDVPLCFALIFANSCPSPLLITGSICEPDLPFSQPVGPVFVSLLPGCITVRCLPNVRLRVMWSIMLNLLHFICFRPNPIMPYS